MQNQPKPTQLLASVAIDYFRWTQLTPMILMWAMVIGMLFILIFVSHEDATWSLIGATADWIASLPWVGPKFVAFMESQAEDGVISPDVGAFDFKSAVLQIWGGISLVFMAVGWLAGLAFGPFEPWTLKRKLGAAALACFLMVAVMMLLYFLDPELWNDGPLMVALTASGMALVMFIVNTWCLSISHALGLLSRHVLQGGTLKQ